MKAKLYVAVSGGIFGLIAVVHLVRLIQRWPVQVGEWSIPMGLSVAGVLVTGILFLWALIAVRTVNQ